MGKDVEFLSYVYPDLVKVKVRGKVRTYLISEYWARKAMVQMRFGNGWKGINLLKKNGEEVSKSNREFLTNLNSKEEQSNG